MGHLPILICIVFMGLLAACSNPQKDAARAQERSYEAPPGAAETSQSTTGAPGDAAGSGRHPILVFRGRLAAEASIAHCVTGASDCLVAAGRQSRR